MRIRSLKPEFWRSPDISQLDPVDRLLFIGLWSYVDDNGVGLDRESNIAADLFADDLTRDPRETLARVASGLEHLAATSRIIRYTVDGRNYLEILNWEKHQRIDRPNKPRYPRNDAESSVIRETLASMSRDPRESPATGTEEQGNRGTGDTNTCSPAPPSSERATRFDEFWATYPRKVGKDKCRAKYTAAVKRAGDEQTIITGAARLAADPNLPEKQYIPHPTTWLERGGWDDEPLPPRMDNLNGSQRRLMQAAEQSRNRQASEAAGQISAFPPIENPFANTRKEIQR